MIDLRDRYKEPETETNDPEDNAAANGLIAVAVIISLVILYLIQNTRVFP